MQILIALIAGIIIGAFFGAQIGWRYAFRELGRAELRNRMSTARSVRKWRNE